MSTLRAGLAPSAIGQSPQFAWIGQSRLSPSTVRRTKHLKSTIVSQPRTNPRFALKRPAARTNSGPKHAAQQRRVRDHPIPIASRAELPALFPFSIPGQRRSISFMICSAQRIASDMALIVAENPCADISRLKLVETSSGVFALPIPHG